MVGFCFVSFSDGLVHMICVCSDKLGRCSWSMLLEGCRISYLGTVEMSASLTGLADSRSCQLIIWMYM